MLTTQTEKICAEYRPPLSRPARARRAPQLNTSPNAEAQLAALAELDDRFAAGHIDYWLFGGWAVDFHAGTITRPHGDIDIAVWWSDRERVAALLANNEWAHRPEPGEDGYTSYERGGIKLEVAYVARGDDGSVYSPLEHGRAEWPRNALGDDVRTLLGVRARVLTREALVEDKSVAHGDALTDAKDRADVATLRNIETIVDPGP